MKKQCNRILAMLLALVTVLSVLPISTIAAPWLDVEQETTTDGGATTNNITVTLDAKALLGYLKDRDINGLIGGLSVNGLRDMISAETLFEIIPEEKFISIIEAVEKDVTPEVLLKYIDLDALLEDIDKKALIDLVMGLEDLTQYIKDGGYEILMGYVDEGKFAEAVPYVDVEGLAKDYSDVLLDLVLALETDKLFALVDLETAIHLKNVDLLEAVKVAYLVEKLGGYDVLYNEYTDKTAMDQFLKDNFMLWADQDKDGVIDASFIDKYIDINAFSDLVKDPAFNKDDFVDDLALEQYIYQLHEDGLLEYSDLKSALDTAALLSDMKDVNSPFRQDPAIQEAVKNAIKHDSTLREELEDALASGAHGEAFKDLMKDLLKGNEEFGDLMKNILRSDDEFLPMMKNILKSDNEFLPMMKNILRSDDDFLLLMKNVLEDNTWICAQIEEALSAALSEGNYGYDTLAPYIDEVAAETYLTSLFADESPEFFDPYYASGAFDVAAFFEDHGNAIDTDAFINNALLPGVTRDKIVEDLMKSGDFDAELDKIFDDLQTTNPELFNKTVDTVFDTLQRDNLELFNKTVDTVFNTLQRDNLELFNKTVDTVFDTLQRDNLALFNKTVDALFDSLQDEHKDLFEKLIDEAYAADPEVLNDVIQDMMDSDTETFNRMLESVLDEVLTEEIFAEDANHLKLDNLMGYIMFDQLIDISGLDPETLRNKGIVDYTALDASLLIKHNMIKVKALFDDGVIKMDDIADYVLINKLTNKIKDLAAAKELDYGELVDAENLKTQILDLLELGKTDPENGLSTSQVLDCVIKDAAGDPDYRKVIDTISGGAKAVVDAIKDAHGVSYGTIIEQYVLPGQFGNLINALGAVDILTELIGDGQMNNAFKVNELITAIGFSNLIKLINVRSLITRLYNDGAFQPILKKVSSDTYIACINMLLNALNNNVREIKINDVAITKYEDRLLYINVEKLMQAIQVAFPTLEELAALEGDVLIDGLGLSVTYVPVGKTETKTYAINATVKLADGADRVRETAEKIKNLINRYLTYSYENNDIVFELRIPDQFATALKLTLDSLGTETDPELLTLRDELLALYDANLSDTANFLQSLTLKQTVTLLEKVDTAPLTNAYNKLMKQRYVEIVLEYIEKATGKDLADVEIGELMETLADVTVPTVEQVAKKVESLTGRDLLSLLPARVEGVWESAQQRKIAEILDSIAANVGMDTDIKQILQNANKTEDPLQYLYDEFVDILENSENAYIAIKERVLDIYDRVIASKLGEHFNTYRLDQLYTGEGKFLLEESLEINPETYISRAIDKVVDLLLQGRQLDQDLIENVKTIALGMIDDESFTFNVSGTLKVDGLYRAAFYDYDATSVTGLKLLGEFFLPVGTDLNLLMEYTTEDPAILFKGWADDDGVIHATMPAKDVVLTPMTSDISCKITVYAPGQIGQEPAWIGTGIGGEKIADDVVNILQGLPVKTWDNDTVTWYAVKNGTKTEWNFAEDVLPTGALVLTWEITHATYTVQVVDPDSKAPVEDGAFTVTRGETLSDEQIKAMKAFVPAYAYGYTWHLVDENDQIVDVKFDLDTEIHSNIKLTWVYNPEPLPEYTITVLDSKGNAVGEPITVEQGTTLESIKDQLLAKTDAATKGLVPAWYEVATDVESVTASDYIELDDTAIMDHYVLTWRYQTITIYDHNNPTAAPITFELGDNNTGISVELLTEKAGLDTDNLPAWYALAYPNAPTKDSAAFTGSTDKVIWDQSYTWKYFTITYYNTHNPALTYTINNIGVGKTLADYQEIINAQAGATSEKTPAWYVVDSATGELADEAISDFNTAIKWDLTVAWKYHRVTIHDPSNYNNTVFFDLGVGQALTREMLETAVGTFEGKHPGWYAVGTNGTYTEADKFTAFDEAISSDIDLTWKFHHVNVWDDAENLLGFVEAGDCDDDGNAVKLESLKAEIMELVTLNSEKAPAWYVASATGKFDAQSARLDWTVDVNGDLHIAWKYYDVVIYSPETGEIKATFVFGDGVKLDTVYAEMKDLAGATAEKTPAWYQTNAALLFGARDKFTAFDSNVTWDMGLTWKYYTVNVYDYTTYQLNLPNQPIATITLGDGQDFNDIYEGTLSYLGYLNDLVAVVDPYGQTLVPAWYLYNGDGRRGSLYQEDLGSALDWDIDLTWHYPVVKVEIWGSTDPEDGEHVHYPNLKDNLHTVSYDSTFGELIANIGDKYAGYEDWLIHASGFEWMSAVYSSFHNEWKQDANGTIDLNSAAKITDDVTIHLYIMPDTTKPSFSIGDGRDKDFEVIVKDGIIYITHHNKENEWNGVESFSWDFDNLKTLVTLDETTQEELEYKYGITFTFTFPDPEVEGKTLTHSVHMSHEMLEAIYGAMMDEDGNPIASTMTLKYTELDVYGAGAVQGPWWPQKEWGCDAIGYTYGFEFDGIPVAGDFFGQRTDGKDVIELTFAFSGKGNVSGNGSAQTFLYVDGEETNGWITDIQADSVTVTAQHFSQFMLINKYRLSYHESTLAWDPSFADMDLLTFQQIGNIFNGDQFVSGYYAAGEPIKRNAGFGLLDRYLGKLNHVQTNMLNSEGVLLTDAPGTMPEEAAELQYIISTPIYHVYYYTYNAEGAAPGYYYAGELAYTRYDAEKLDWNTVSVYLPDLLGGGAWFGIDEAGWNQCINGSPKDVYLVWAEDDAPVADRYTVTFKWDDANGTTFTIKMSLVDWIGHGIGSLQGADGLIAAELEKLDLTVPNSEIIKWSITIDNKIYDLSDLTVEQWIALFNASAVTPIVFEASRTERYYTINTDGNIVDLKPDSQARPGDRVTFMPIFKEGMLISIKLYADGVDISDRVQLLSGLSCWSFEMPASDVYIKVIYKARAFSYVDQNGNTVEGVLYGDRITYTLEIPSNYWIDFAELNAVIKAFREDLILIGSETAENGNLLLTYALNLTEDGVNFTALHAETTKLVKEMSYRTVYVVNGTYYFTEQEALAACPEGVRIAWERGFYENMFIASFEKLEVEEEPSFVWLIILLAVLFLILVIAIIYILYICGKLKPNWFLKGITAIVSAFFAICMGVAHVVMAIVRFAGHEETELMEKESKRFSKGGSENAPTSSEEAVEAPATEPEQGAEEVPAEEPASEITEEATEKATEKTADPTETATAEEAIEIVVEDVVDETIDEVLTEASEEAVEEVATENSEATAEDVTAERSADGSEQTNE